MNPVTKALLKALLRGLVKLLGRLDDTQLKKLAGQINAKVNIPRIDEDTEGKIILATLKGSAEALIIVANAIEV